VPFLPFTIALGRPSRTELPILSGTVVLVGSAAAWGGTTARQQPRAPDAPPDAAPLVITSTPTGAVVAMDGQDRGTTRLTLRVAGDGWGVSWTLGNLGRVACDQVNYQRAEALFKERRGACRASE
jgi:hypothetical protein